MHRKTNKFLVGIAIFAVLLANAAMSLAEENVQGFRINTEGDFEEVADTVEAEIKSKSPTPDQQQFLERVQKELDLTKTDYKQLLNSIADTKNRLEHLHEEKLSLQEQIANLDGDIEVNQKKLVQVIEKIVETENEMRLIYNEIETREVAVEYQKSLVEDYLKVIYQEENEFFEFEEDGSVDAFKLLLSDGSVSDNLSQITYFDLLSEAGAQMIDDLDRLFKELNAYRKELDKRRDKLSILKEELDAEKEELALRKESKARLLRITAGQEEIYEELLGETLEQQEDLIADLKSLNDSVALIERKLEEEGADFDINKYEALLDDRTQALYDFKIESLGVEHDGFVWPVEPKRGISAYFRDSAYVGVFGVQHNAVDIPEYQGSPVRAAADGVVYAAKDNGYGYSYVIIAHAGGFQSVYGHISEILVQEGQSIGQGSILGLSGGMPGTKGAGYMTTGPHLHFEVLLNGAYVDPLLYLPLSIFTEEEIQGMPVKYHDDWEVQVLKEVFEPVSRF